MSYPANFCALDIPFARLGRCKPTHNLSARNGILFEAKYRDGKGVQHVQRFQLVKVGGVFHQVQLIDGLYIVRSVELAICSRMDECPGPLLGNNADGEVGIFGQTLLDIVPDEYRPRDDKDVEYENQIVGN